MNSRTSRPRSPIRAMTLTSARVLLAIIPSSTLLPTPEPAMIPMRCPWPQVSRPLIERIPRSRGVSILLRSIGPAGRAYRGISLRQGRQAAAVDRLPHGIDHPAEERIADRQGGAVAHAPGSGCRGPARAVRRGASATPGNRENRRPPPAPASPPFRGISSQRLPTVDAGQYPSTTRPTILVTLPATLKVFSPCSRCISWFIMPPPRRRSGSGGSPPAGSRWSHRLHRAPIPGDSRRGRCSGRLRW